MLHYLPTVIYFAGWAQLVLALCSIAIPIVLRWNEEMKKVSALMRSIFATYSVYIFGTNIWFGVVSILYAEELVSGSGLATSLTVFITLYWLVRVLVQFIFGKAEGRPIGWFFTFAEWGLWLLFLALTLVYGYAAALNLSWI